MAIDNWSAPAAGDGLSYRDWVAKLLVAAGDRSFATPHVLAAGEGIQSITDSPFAGISSTVWDVIDARAVVPGAFVDHVQFDGWTGGSPPTWTLDAIRAAAGLPTTYYRVYSPSAGVTTQTEVLALRNKLLRRRRYREIRTPADAFDTHGNAAAVGLRADLVSIEPGAPRTYPPHPFERPLGQVSGYFTGKVYRCTSTSPVAWAYDPAGGPPDVLDNALAAPFACCEGDEWQQPQNLLTSGTFGRTLHGDLLTLHKLQEAWGILDLMRWTSSSGGSFAARFRSADSGVGDPDANAAAASAAANYSAATPTADFFATPYALANQTETPLGGGGSTFFTSLERRVVTITCTGLPTRTRKHQAWMKAVALGGGTFAAHGDNVQEGAWAPIGPEGTSSAATLALPEVGAIDEPPQPAGNGVVGWQAAAGPLAILKWNVDGGFSHCSVTA